MNKKKTNIQITRPPATCIPQDSQIREQAFFLPLRVMKENGRGIADLEEIFLAEKIENKSLLLPYSVLLRSPPTV
jgi:hypothetical protein